ncbi:hypothetical protein QKW35_10170 [Pontibacterium granulatum]|uniref:hypothetical protein n=1 Tax=Pontibacterium granulatum TaxID=2036029 RepID=UPI00249A4B3D|nr:hypothetical protein [Pontibacterium granulatum]MDI3324741.1 hypothetical protein [Pontibacterium granulatum]
MKLINIDEDAPDTFYIFVNQLNPITEHNFKHTKTFSSGAVASCMNEDFARKFVDGTARYLPYEPCEFDNLAVSPYCLTAINDYRIEYDAEVYREKHHPLYPSRLSALYAFGSMEMCQLVSQRYGWQLDSVHKFRLKDWPLTRIAKVNMEHVSLARHAYKVSMMQDIDRLWGGYWSGFDEIILELPSHDFTRKQYSSGVIWEYLIEGVVECC